MNEQQHDPQRPDRRRMAKIAIMQARVTEGLASGIGERSMAELRDAAREAAPEARGTKEPSPWGEGGERQRAG
jgi:hypothetical protein